MNVLNIKKIIIILSMVIALLLSIFTILKILEEPSIRTIDIPNIKNIEFSSTIESSAQTNIDSTNNNFDYQLIGYRSGKTDYSVILKKGNMEYVVSDGDKLEGIYELVSVNEDEVIFSNQGKIYKIKNTVGK